MLKRKMYRRRPRRRVKRRMAYKKKTYRRGTRTNYYRTKRFVSLQTWTPNTVSTDGFWRYYDFSLDQLGVNLTADFGIFDEYKINALKFTFRPRYNAVDGNDYPTQNKNPVMISVIRDPMNSTTPAGVYGRTTFNEAFAINGNVKTYSGFSPVSVYFKPRITSMVTGSIGRKESAQYLQCNANGFSIKHQGFHVFVHDNNFSANWSTASMEVMVTAYITARGLK